MRLRATTPRGAARKAGLGNKEVVERRFLMAYILLDFPSWRRHAMDHRDVGRRRIGPMNGALLMTHHRL